MSFDQQKQLILAAWVATILVIGVMFAIEKPNLWVFVAGLALGPSAIAHWLWNAPQATMSQLIATAKARS
jgi:hypothetical protein